MIIVSDNQNSYRHPKRITGGTMFPKDTPFQPEPRNPLTEVIGHQLGNTLYIVSATCDGKETINQKIERHILKDDETAGDIV
jgi:hypothetical protein